MIQALCPVCGAVLAQQPQLWQCEGGHCFDRAKQGYVNLLTVNQKHSLHPGDTREQVAARKEFLDAGYYMPIADKVCALLEQDAPQSILDAGCGEGYYLTRLGAAFPSAALWGLDISKEAVRYAATRCRNARWLVGTAARLPFAPHSFDCVISLFALTVETEFLRVLKPGGVYVQVLAGPEHLMALKQLIYPEILRREKQLRPELTGFQLESSEQLDFPVVLSENRQIQNLLAMTPHFFRIGKQGAQAVAEAERLEDVAQVVFNRYRACVP